MLAVRRADDRFFSDLNSISYQRALHYGSFFHFHARHQNTVDDLGPRTDLSPCKQYRVPYFSFNDAALRDKRAFDLGFRTDILRKGSYIFCINLPGRVI